MVLAAPGRCTVEGMRLKEKRESEAALAMFYPQMQTTSFACNSRALAIHVRNNHTLLGGVELRYPPVFVGGLQTSAETVRTYIPWILVAALRSRGKDAILYYLELLLYLKEGHWCTNRTKCIAVAPVQRRTYSSASQRHRFDARAQQCPRDEHVEQDGQQAPDQGLPTRLWGTSTAVQACGRMACAAVARSDELYSPRGQVW